MGITIKQIAEIAGVSRGTVDRAINNRGGVNKEVADKIMSIAEEMRYVPNVAGRALSLQNKYKKIVVIIHSVENEFFELIHHGLRKAKHEISNLGFRVVIKEFTGFDVKNQLKLLDKARDDGADYIAVMPINAPEIADKLTEFIESGIEILTINNDIDVPNRLAYVGCDYRKSGQTAAGLFGLITGGRANVGIITGSRSIDGHNNRIRGFSEITRREFPGVHIVDTVENQDNDALSYDVVKALLAEHKEIDSLLFSAAGTKGGIKAVCDLSLSGKIKIITFDMTPAVKAYIERDIVSATICQQPLEQGYNAIKVFYDYAIRNKKPNDPMLHTQIEIYLKYNIN
ncbi:MAG: LacI family DNA-binding transcriptional regulator [Clostridiales bacterium]|jgi:LacI family transcriptional regulator|nr:LacI family DNA-binding transcriptional regulator [Clostridiales bacterium]